MILNRKDIQLIAAFHGKKVIVVGGKYTEDSVVGDIFPRCISSEFENELVEKAGWHQTDEKATFVFTNTSSSRFWVMNVYDTEVILISFAKSWVWREEKVPGNIFKGRDLVLEVCKNSLI